MVITTLKSTELKNLVFVSLKLTLPNDFKEKSTTSSNLMPTAIWYKTLASSNVKVNTFKEFLHTLLERPTKLRLQLNKATGVDRSGELVLESLPGPRGLCPRACNPWPVYLGPAFAWWLNRCGLVDESSPPLEIWCGPVTWTPCAFSLARPLPGPTACKKFDSL